MDEKLTVADIYKQHQAGWALHGKNKIADLVFRQQDGPWYEFDIVWCHRPNHVNDFFDHLKNLSGVIDGDVYLIGKDQNRVCFEKIIVSGNDDSFGMRDYRANSFSFFENIIDFVERVLTFLRS